jgi:hypothetical protein
MSERPVDVPRVTRTITPFGHHTTAVGTIQVESAGQYNKTFVFFTINQPDIRPVVTAWGPLLLRPTPFDPPFDPSGGPYRTGLVGFCLLSIISSA